MTRLSYSASVSLVISVPLAAKTRPPWLRQISRSYWHTPISGCLRQSSATLGVNSIAVCWRSPLLSTTHTYAVPGGTTGGTIGAVAVLAASGDGAGGSALRTTGELATSCVGV